MSAPAKTEIPPVESLIEKVVRYNPKSDQDLIRKAYEFGLAAHDGQFRKSGEPYFSHPVAVAELLTEIRIDDATIITALLHDTVEDTGVGYEDVKREFGENVADMVNGVTKLTNMEIRSDQSVEVENLRKLLLALSRDVRVMLVKLADRLHNMRTIKSMPPEKQRKKARETMDIYAPLAGRMGMQYLREELEDLAFQVLNPQARSSIMRKFVAMSGENNQRLEDIIADIEKNLKEADIDAQVTGREKRPYSIWRKIQNKGEGFQQLSDIFAFRIITGEVEDCYRALGAVHARWRAVPGRFKDYISQPKSNGYRSLHTTVAGRDGKRVEMQIRTRKMHIVAESGIAAHWAYKDGERVHNPYQVDPSKWLSDLGEGLLDHEDDEEFMEEFKLEMYVDQVFVFSPKGKVVRLPRGATAIDFAYAIHTNLGNHAVGAFVDGKRASLSTPLRNGQTVKIIQAEGAQPDAHWAQTAKTARARAAIRRAIKSKKRDSDLHMGREIARVAFEQINKSATPKALDTAARMMGYPNSDELLMALSSAEISSQDMLHALYPEMAKEAPQKADPISLAPMMGASPAFSSHPGQCCLPIPGDRIVGVTRKGHGITYHIIDCAELALSEDNEDENWVDLRWPEPIEGAAYPTRIIVVMLNDAGVLGRVCTIIGENHSNIEQLEFLEKRPDLYTCLFEISVRNNEHLFNIIAAVETDTAVAECYRYRREPTKEETDDAQARIEH